MPSQCCLLLTGVFTKALAIVGIHKYNLVYCRHSSFRVQQHLQPSQQQHHIEHHDRASSCMVHALHLCLSVLRQERHICWYSNSTSQPTLKGYAAAHVNAADKSCCNTLTCYLLAILASEIFEWCVATAVLQAIQGGAELQHKTSQSTCE